MSVERNQKEDDPADQLPSRETEPVEESDLAKDQKAKSYYYDDSFGYKVFDPENDDEENDDE